MGVFPGMPVMRKALTGSGRNRGADYHEVARLLQLFIGIEDMNRIALNKFG